MKSDNRLSGESCTHSRRRTYSSSARAPLYAREYARREGKRKEKYKRAPCIYFLPTLSIYRSANLERARFVLLFFSARVSGLVTSTRGGAFAIHADARITNFHESSSPGQDYARLRALVRRVILSYREQFIDRNRRTRNSVRA